jgi:hypothetical protein
VIESDPATLATVLWHGRRLDEEGVTISGSRAAAKRFLKLFPLPA